MIENYQPMVTTRLDLCSGTCPLAAESGFTNLRFEDMTQNSEKTDQWDASSSDVVSYLVCYTGCGR